MSSSAAKIRAAADTERTGGEEIRALHAGFRALLRHESNPFDPIAFNISHRPQKENTLKQQNGREAFMKSSIFITAIVIQ
ncbi:MAG: hypothetical protein GX417_02475 [Clostridiales bacterium]|nr:hypothetical protein [Clostridiales bacterium]